MSDEYWKYQEIIESQGHICIAILPKCDQTKDKCNFIGYFLWFYYLFTVTAFWTEIEKSVTGSIWFKLDRNNHRHILEMILTNANVKCENVNNIRMEMSDVQDCLNTFSDESWTLTFQSVSAGQYHSI